MTRFKLELEIFFYRPIFNNQFHFNPRESLWSNNSSTRKLVAPCNFHGNLLTLNLPQRFHHLTSYIPRKKCYSSHLRSRCHPLPSNSLATEYSLPSTSFNLSKISLFIYPKKRSKRERKRERRSNFESIYGKKFQTSLVALLKFLKKLLTIIAF